VRVPGFANKKYETHFYVEARRESTETYHLRDLNYTSIPRLAAPQLREPRKKKSFAANQFEPIEHDWAFANAPCSRDDPEEVSRKLHNIAPQITESEYYARHTVEKAMAELKIPTPQHRSNLSANGDKNRSLDISPTQASKSISKYLRLRMEHSTPLMSAIRLVQSRERRQKSGKAENA